LKRKDFLRGFGCGVIIAASIIGIAILNTKPTVTDAEIIARAEALGMMTEDQAKEKELDSIKQEAISGSAVASSTGENVSSAGIADESSGGSGSTSSEVSSEPSTFHVSENNGAVATGATIVSSAAVTDDNSEDSKSETIKKSEPEKSTGSADTKDSESVKSTEKTNYQTATTSDTSSASCTLAIKSGMYSEEVSRILASNGIVDSSSKFNSYLIKNGYSDRISVGTYTLKQGMTYAEIARIITR